MAVVTTRTAAAAAISTVFLLLYFLAGAFGRIEGPAFGISEQHQQRLARTFPQRWAFFTKSPTEPRMHLYVRSDDNRWLEVPLVAGIGYETRLGFRRDSRAKGRELGTIAGEFMPFEWFSCDTYVIDCLPDPPTTAVIDRLPDVFQGVCGEMAIVMQPPVPWAWRDSRVAMPSHFAKFEVPCTAD